MSARATPEVGSIWQGGGMTVRVVEVWDEDARVERLTGRGRLLKRPVRAGFIPLRYFHEGRMKLLDPTRTDVWARAILDRYALSPVAARSEEPT